MMTEKDTYCVMCLSNGNYIRFWNDGNEELVSLDGDFAIEDLRLILKLMELPHD